MSTLRALGKLLFGETWLLPIGIVLAVGVAALGRGLAPHGWWPAADGLVLLALLIGVLYASVSTARR